MTSPSKNVPLPSGFPDLAHLFAQQHEFINYFFSRLDMNDVETFTSLILQCQGIIYISGQGKSGIVARNISQMMVSVGVRASFLSPVDALHGDVGVLRSDDIVVMLSKSGQTSEVLSMIAPVKAKGAYTVAIVCNTDSKIASQCDCVIHLPLQRELCPFDLAPTTSTIIQVIFGNTIVAGLMRRIEITREQYAMNHPAGRIGKRLTLRVDDVMRKKDELAMCAATDDIVKMLPSMTKSFGCLLITDAAQNDKLLGIFTDGDLRRALAKDGPDALKRPIKDLMNSNPTRFTSGEMAWDAMQEMERHDPQTGKKRINQLPIVDNDGCCVGLLTLHELIQAGL